MVRKKDYGFLIGKTFGNIVVLEKDIGKSSKMRRQYFVFKCKCGKIKTARASDIENGDITSCGSKQCMTPRYVDIKNHRYNSLVAVEYVKTLNKKAYWLCECDCGNICVVSQSNLKSGHTKSCGCNRLRNNNGTFIKHLRNILTPIIKEKLKQSDYRCEISGLADGVQVHHITSFKSIYEKVLKELGLDIRQNLNEYSRAEIDLIDSKFIKENKDVLVVLSKELHTQFHKIYGYKNFTERDFNDFKNKIKKLII